MPHTAYYIHKLLLSAGHIYKIHLCISAFACMRIRFGERFVSVDRRSWHTWCSGAPCHSNHWDDGNAHSIKNPKPIMKRRLPRLYRALISHKHQHQYWVRRCCVRVRHAFCLTHTHTAYYVTGSVPNDWAALSLSSCGTTAISERRWWSCDIQDYYYIH